MIIEIDTEKAANTAKCPFMTKSLNKISIKGHSFVNT